MEWSINEVEETVADYFHMLTMELANQKYNKAEHNRLLLQRLTNRTRGAIERKHMNISAVLNDLGCFSIPGYKPLGNYQQLLFNVVAKRLRDGDTLDRAALAAAEMPATTPSSLEFSKVAAEAPVRSPRIEDAATYAAPKERSAVHRDYIAREARNASLGLAGELFVVEYERWRLIEFGKKKLAEKIEHVSSTRGDGLGYDVISYETSGKERLIEVKTTAFSKETPFFVTQNELSASRDLGDVYHLARVFEFRKSPKLFTLPGAIDRHCYLNPTNYLAKFA